MNIYYHDFQIGFNAWYIVAPAILLLAIVIDSIERLRFTWGWDGITASYVVWCGKRPADSATQTNLFLGLKLVVMILGTSIFALLFWEESWRGLVQWFDNRLMPNESGVWSLCAAPVAYLLTVALFGFVLLIMLDHGYIMAVVAVFLVNILSILARAFCKIARGAAYVAATLYREFRPERPVRPDPSGCSESPERPRRQSCRRRQQTQC